MQESRIWKSSPPKQPPPPPPQAQLASFLRNIAFLIFHNGKKRLSEIVVFNNPLSLTSPCQRFCIKINCEYVIRS